MLFPQGAFLAPQGAFPAAPDPGAATGVRTARSPGRPPTRKDLM